MTYPHGGGSWSGGVSPPSAPGAHQKREGAARSTAAGRRASKVHQTMENNLSGNNLSGNSAAENSYADVDKLSFERAIEELESIVKRLEEGKVPLEESVAIYERGEVLKRRCEHLLRQAEARVEKIALDASGKPKGAEPLDVK
jgi:exodeoxyribonuclease VII small subunit